MFSSKLIIYFLLIFFFAVFCFIFCILKFSRFFLLLSTLSRLLARYIHLFKFQSSIPSAMNAGRRNKI
jgi:hypothetical protein